MNVSWTKSQEEEQGLVKEQGRVEAHNDIVFIEQRQGTRKRSVFAERRGRIGGVRRGGAEMQVGMSVWRDFIRMTGEISVSETVAGGVCGVVFGFLIEFLP
jgi:hypothetical protein